MKKIGEEKKPQTEFIFDEKVPPRHIWGQDDFTTRASKRLAYVESTTEQFLFTQDFD